MNIFKKGHYTVLAILLSISSGYSSSFNFEREDGNDRKRITRPVSAKTKMMIDAPYKTDIVVEQPNSGPRLWYQTSNPDGTACFSNDGSALRVFIGSSKPRNNTETQETVAQMCADIETILKFTGGITPSEQSANTQMLRLAENTKTPSKRNKR